MLPYRTWVQIANINTKLDFWLVLVPDKLVAMVAVEYRQFIVECSHFIGLLKLKINLFENDIFIVCEQRDFFVWTYVDAFHLSCVISSFLIGIKVSRNGVVFKSTSKVWFIVYGQK